MLLLLRLGRQRLLVVLGEGGSAFFALTFEVAGCDGMSVSSLEVVVSDGSSAYSEVAVDSYDSCASPSAEAGICAPPSSQEVDSSTVSDS